MVNCPWRAVLILPSDDSESSANFYSGLAGVFVASAIISVLMELRVGEVVSDLVVVVVCDGYACAKEFALPVDEGMDLLDFTGAYGHHRCDGVVGREGAGCCSGRW